MKITGNKPLSVLARNMLIISLLIIAIIWLVIRSIVPVMEGFLVMTKPLQHADALVVMAGEVPIRLPAAARLYKAGKADRILLTNDGVLGGWSEQKQRNLYQVEWAEDELLKRGIPWNAIVKLSYSSSGSIYDALNTRTAVLNREIKSIIIVTSDYHTRRSLWTFDRVFRDSPVQIGVYPAKSRISTMSDIGKFLFLSYEMTKYVYYRCRFINIK